MSVSSTTPSVVSSPKTALAINRTNIALIALLLVQLVLTAFIYWPSGQVTSNGEPLLAGVTADAVTSLTITDANDRSVSLVKEGDLWTLDGTDGYPARENKITETLDKLLAITGDRLVTQTSGSHGRLQVAEDNYLRKVELTTADGVKTLYFGSSAGAGATHVRPDGEDATFLTNEIATWELDTLSTTWIDVTYHRVPKEQIAEVTLENAHGTFQFVREGDGWTLADATPDEPIASANISTMVDRVATLNLHTVLGKSELPEYGLDNPLATLTVVSSETTTDTTEAETKTTTILVGAKDEETNTYYVKSSESDFYVRVAAFTGDKFAESQRQDFMIQSSEDSDATEGSDATDDTGDAESTAPDVEASDVTTATGEVEDQAALTTTVEASDVQTDTAESEVDSTEVTTATTGLEDEPQAEPTVEASEITTGTEETAEDSDAEPTATPDE